MREHHVEGVRDLMWLFEKKLQVWALNILCKGFKPSISVDYISAELNFEDRDSCLEFLDTLGCILDKNKSSLLFKESKQAVAESKLLQGGFD